MYRLDLLNIRGTFHNILTRVTAATIDDTCPHFNKVICKFWDTRAFGRSISWIIILLGFGFRSILEFVLNLFLRKLLEECCGDRSIIAYRPCGAMVSALDF